MAKSDVWDVPADRAPNEAPDPKKHNQYGKPKTAPTGKEPTGHKIGKDEAEAPYMNSNDQKQDADVNLGILAGKRRKGYNTGLSKNEVQEEIDEIRRRAGLLFD